MQRSELATMLNETKTSTFIGGSLLEKNERGEKIAMFEKT